MTAARLSSALPRRARLAPAAAGAHPPRRTAAPTGLHALPAARRRAAAARRTFSRTPSFAWKPVRGRVRYEFQLSTSEHASATAASSTRTRADEPVASRSRSRCRGSPASPYCPVRPRARRHADRHDAVDATYGFNMRWPTAAEPIESCPGPAPLDARRRAPRATRSGSSTRGKRDHDATRTSPTSASATRSTRPRRGRAPSSGASARVRMLTARANGLPPSRTGRGARSTRRQPAVRDRPAAAWSPRVSRHGHRRSGSPRRAPADARVSSSPATRLVRRRGDRALPRLRLHRQRLRQHRLHGRDRRLAGLRAARRGPLELPDSLSGIAAARAQVPPRR